MKRRISKAKSATKTKAKQRPPATKTKNPLSKKHRKTIQANRVRAKIAEKLDEGLHEPYDAGAIAFPDVPAQPIVPSSPAPTTVIDHLTAPAAPAAATIVNPEPEPEKEPQP